MADSLRTDPQCFHRVELDKPAIVRLRELSRMDQDLQTDSNRLSNQLWEQLRRYYPHIMKTEPGSRRGLGMGCAGIGSAAGGWREIEAGEGERDSAGASDPPCYGRAGARSAPPTRAAAGAGSGEKAASEHVLMLLPRLRLLQRRRSVPRPSASSAFWKSYAHRRRSAKGASIATRRSCFPFRHRAGRRRHDARRGFAAPQRTRLSGFA